MFIGIDDKKTSVEVKEHHITGQERQDQNLPVRCGKLNWALKEEVDQIASTHMSKIMKKGNISASLESYKSFNMMEDKEWQCEFQESRDLGFLICHYALKNLEHCLAHNKDSKTFARCMAW